MAINITPLLALQDAVAVVGRRVPSLEHLVAIRLITILLVEAHRYEIRAVP
jgi:hypothetical protein